MKPAIMRSVVVLPQPGRPEQHDELALFDVEVDAGDGAEIAVRLGETGELQARHALRES